ncbi:unnamed protein product [Parajaminaea phylloscopi]
MVTRGAKRDAGNKAASSRSENDSQSLQLATLDPKPCITCGRVITPRAKWAKNWDSIKTCSDSCKAFKPNVKSAGYWVYTDGTARLPSDSGSDVVLQTLSQSILVQPPSGDATQNDGSKVHVAIDAWVERALLRTAAPSTASKAQLPTCDALEPRLLQAAKTFDAAFPSALPPSSGKGPTSLADALQDGGPGLRERVRRAARRLFVLEPADWATGDESVGLQLLQEGKVLNGLEGASFAKGPIQYRRRE